MQQCTCSFSATFTPALITAATSNDAARSSAVNTAAVVPPIAPNAQAAILAFSGFAQRLLPHKPDGSIAFVGTLDTYSYRSELPAANPFGSWVRNRPSAGL